MILISQKIWSFVIWEMKYRQSQIPGGELFFKNKLPLDSDFASSLPGGEFTVFVQFAIGNDGKLKDITIVKDPGYGLGEKVKKVIDNYKGYWKPAMLKGRPVLSYRKQSITFIIVEEEVCEDELSETLIP